MGQNSTEHDMVNIRLFTDADYPMVEAWWRIHHGNDFRRGYAPASSFIVNVDGVDSGFFGVAPMTPDISYFAFPLTNPDVSKDVRDRTVDAMIDYAKIVAANDGTPVLWISIRGEKFLNRLGAKGFVAGEEGNKHMFCKVGDIS